MLFRSALLEKTAFAVLIIILSYILKKSLSLLSTQTFPVFITSLVISFFSYPVLFGRLVSLRSLVSAARSRVRTVAEGMSNIRPIVAESSPAK